MNVADIELVCLLSKQNLGISIIPEMMVATRTEYFKQDGNETLYNFPIDDRTSERKLVICYNGKFPLPLYSRLFVDTVIETYNDLLNTKTKPLC